MLESNRKCTREDIFKIISTVVSHQLRKDRTIASISQRQQTIHQEFSHRWLWDRTHISFIRIQANPASTILQCLLRGAVKVNCPPSKLQLRTITCKISIKADKKAPLIGKCSQFRQVDLISKNHLTWIVKDSRPRMALMGNQHS